MRKCYDCPRPHYFAYFKYILRHKWYVFKECLKLKTSLYRAIMHDMSKFRPSEFIPYANWFYGRYGREFDNSSFTWDQNEHKEAKEKFDRAWLLHQHRNDHHWQYWILREDDGDTQIISPTWGALKEMIADWKGAGKAITGKDDVIEWYNKNKDKIIVNLVTRNLIEDLIGFPTRKR